ncbi:MAG: hypothetical protein ABSA47_11400 [Verrucomicrobiota bacterium]|jgi:hypothetical protein
MEFTTQETKLIERLRKQDRLWSGRPFCVRHLGHYCGIGQRRVRSHGLGPMNMRVEQPDFSRLHLTNPSLCDTTSRSMRPKETNVRTGPDDHPSGAAPVISRQSGAKCQNQPTRDKSVDSHPSGRIRPNSSEFKHIQVRKIIFLNENGKIGKIGARKPDRGNDLRPPCGLEIGRPAP